MLASHLNPQENKLKRSQKVYFKDIIFSIHSLFPLGLFVPFLLHHPAGPLGDVMSPFVVHNKICMCFFEKQVWYRFVSHTVTNTGRGRESESRCEVTMTTYPLIPELRKLDALTLIGCTDWAREGFRRVIFQQREQYRWSMTAGPVAQTLTNLTKFLQKFENFTCKLLFS